VNLGPVQHVRQRAADQFAHAKLALRRAGPVLKRLFDMGVPIGPFARARNAGLSARAIGARTGANAKGARHGNLPGLVVTGASGRMGQTLIRLAQASDKLRLVGCVERAGHPWIGRDVGEAMGGSPGRQSHRRRAGGLRQGPGRRRLHRPAATVEFAALAAQARAVHVIGTTGLEAEHLARIEAAARHAPIIRAGNMSLGVNLLTRLTQKVAAALDADWDVEIVEAHHRMKVDAPRAPR
jgi:hypothetical protein